MPNNTSSSDLLTPEELKIWRRITDEQYEELLRRGLPFIQTKSGVRHFKNEVDFWFGAVPPGAPKWVTGERISDTIRVWQPSYKQLTGFLSTTFCRCNHSSNLRTLSTCCISR
jgi:hypothetical protein